MEDKILGKELLEDNQPIKELNEEPVTENASLEGETVFCFDEESVTEETTEDIMPTVEIDENGAIVVEFGTDEDNVDEPVVEPEVEPEIEPEIEPVVEEISDNNEPTPEIIKEEQAENNDTDFVPLPVTNNKKEKAPKPKKQKHVKVNPEPVIGYESNDNNDRNNKKTKKLEKEKEKKAKDRKKNLISFILLLLLFAIPVGFLVYIIMAILSFF